MTREEYEFNQRKSFEEPQLRIIYKGSESVMPLSEITSMRNEAERMSAIADVTLKRCDSILSAIKGFAKSFREALNENA